MSKVVLDDITIDSLMEDWFDRDPETYVVARSDGRLGWESRVDLGEDSYSSYILEAPEGIELVKRAYPIARDMITAMELPIKTKLKLTMDGSRTDGKAVYLCTKVFESELTVGEQMDVFLGYAIHEGCHILYTDMKVLRDWTKDVTTSMSPRKILLVKHIANILEDERIEQLLGGYKPGFTRFLEKTKYYLFDEFSTLMDKSEKPTTDFDRLMIIFFKIIRYPKYLVEEDILFFGRHLLKVRDILTPYPTSFKEVMDSSEKIFEVFLDFYTEKKEAEETSESVDSDSGSGEGEGGEDSDSDKGETSPDKSSDKGGGKSWKDFTDEEKRAAIEATVTAESSKVTDALKVFEGDPLASKDVTDKKIDRGVIEGDIESGYSSKAFFEKVPSSQTVYLESLGRVKQYIPAVRNKLRTSFKEYKLIHRAMRSGVLDTNKLVEAVQGVPTVYMKEGEVTTDKLTCCVLIDESGSMNGDRIRAARDTAVLINEAVGCIPDVELFIYGHSADRLTDDSTEVLVYREPGNSIRYALGSVTAKNQNRDGVAIIETAKRVRKFTQRPCLMFILSDGAPAAGDYYGPDAINHTKRCVGEAEKLGFDVVQIAINHSYNPATMFKHFIILDDLSNLATSLTKLIKNSLTKKAKTRVT